jgi:hypothetical protein
MSLAKVKTALETALAAMTPPLATAWPNVEFKPPVGSSTPWQTASVLTASPDNLETGNVYYREQGVFLVRLHYPLKTGSGAAVARGELLRSVFYRGASFTSDGIIVTIEQTPEIAAGSVEGDRWVVPVRIRFYANVEN